MMEIELLAELESPHIVGYLDAFIEDTRINIIMEIIEIRFQREVEILYQIIFRSDT